MMNATDVTSQATGLGTVRMITTMASGDPALEDPGHHGEVATDPGVVLAPVAISAPGAGAAAQGAVVTEAAEIGAVVTGPAETARGDAPGAGHTAGAAATTGRHPDLGQGHAASPEAGRGHPKTRLLMGQSRGHRVNHRTVTSQHHQCNHLLRFHHHDHQCRQTGITTNHSFIIMQNILDCSLLLINPFSAENKFICFCKQCRPRSEGSLRSPSIKGLLCL